MLLENALLTSKNFQIKDLFLFFMLDGHAYLI